MKTKTIPIPKQRGKRALLLIDIQHGFVKRWKEPFLSNLKQLFAEIDYDLYVEVTFHAEKGSLWDKQTDWTFPYEPTIPEVQKLLKKEKHVTHIVKETKSAFEGDKDLHAILKRHGIKEVHVVGFDSADCVLTTAQDAFDLGFFTYVIEECTGASEGKKIHKDALEILRSLGLTNHS